MSKPRVVVSLLTKDQEFQAQQAAEAQSAANHAGFDVEIVFANSNGSLQREQLYRFIHSLQTSRPLAIVVQTVAGDGMPPVARDATKAGIGWVLLNRDAGYIDELRAEHGQLPIGIVTVDQVAIGRIQGRQFRTLLPRGGNVLYIQGPPDTSAAKQRLQGVQEVILNSGINIKSLNGEWTEGSGEKAVTSWLRLSTSGDYPLDLVGAQNDAMAVGARKAIAAARPEWLKRPFTGCDGLPDGGQRLVREGTLSATVIVPPSAGVAASLLAAHSKGTPLPARTILEPRPFPV